LDRKLKKVTFEDDSRDQVSKHSCTVQSNLIWAWLSRWIWELGIPGRAYISTEAGQELDRFTTYRCALCAAQMTP